MSDRIGITSNFYLTDAEVADLVAGGFDAAESVRNFRFFTNAFATSSQGIDVFTTYTPLGLRGNTMISAAFNHTDTQVTDNAKGLLDGRRLAGYAYALPRTRGNVGVKQRLGPVNLFGRVSYYSGWYDYDSGHGAVFTPSGDWPKGSSPAGRSSTSKSVSRLPREQRWPLAAGTSWTPIRRCRRSRGRSASSTASTRRGATAAPTSTCDTPLLRWRSALGGDTLPASAVEATSA